MPEKRYLRVGAALLDEFRHQREVVILYQHDRALDRANLLEHRFGEKSVHFTVREPVFFPEYRTHVREVRKRPESLI